MSVQTKIVGIREVRVRDKPSTGANTVGRVYRNDTVAVVVVKFTDLKWAKIITPVVGWVPYFSLLATTQDVAK